MFFIDVGAAVVFEQNHMSSMKMIRSKRIDKYTELEREGMVKRKLKSGRRQKGYRAVLCCAESMSFLFGWQTKRKEKKAKEPIAYVPTALQSKVSKTESIKIKKYMKADTFMCFNATCISLRSNFPAPM